MANRGIFITFEGIDGCGKTTQMRLLIDRLRATGYDVLETAEPGGTRIGTQVRRILLDSANQELSPTAELLLYFACRAQNVDEWIKPAIEQGQIVISDRFTDSTVAYQGAGRGLGVQTVMQLHEIACRGVNPDLTIIVDIDLETSLGRAKKRNKTLSEQQQPDETRMDEQAVEFHRKARDAYAELARTESSRICVIDGRRSIEAIAEDIWRVVRENLDVR
jgi:dTMP kinase